MGGCKHQAQVYLLQHKEGIKLHIGTSLFRGPETPSCQRCGATDSIMCDVLKIVSNNTALLAYLAQRPLGRQLLAYN